MSHQRVGLTVFALILSCAALVFAGVGKETMVLEVPGKYGNVVLPHWEHQENLGDCNACHVLFPQKQGGIDELKANRALKKKAVMNTCRSCHKGLAKTGKPSGPIRCFDCHAKG
ncbi:MAG: cytochrome c family protein [Desulfobacterales bacterium]|nr:cytochrome c family protein [Desulfobacterales bacterium]